VKLTLEKLEFQEFQEMLKTKCGSLLHFGFSHSY